MSKFIDAINNQIAKAFQNYHENGIPADRLINQSPSRAIPPATPTAKGGVTISNATPQAVGTATSGTNTPVARDDHVHAHGNQAGGSLHANATTGVAGFQSATDKSKEDKYPAISGLTTGDVLTALSATTIGFQAPTGVSGITIQEVDGTPSESAPTKLIFPNGTVSVSSHEVTYTPSGGGGSDVSTGTVAVVIPGLAGSADISGAAGGGTTEEYDTATTGLTWTPSTPATVDSNTTILSHLYIKSTDGTERFGTKAWSPAGAFDARCKLSVGARDTSTSADIGLIVGDSGLSNFALLQLSDNTAIPAYRVFAYSYNGSYTQRGSTWTTNNTDIYARITRDGSNNVSWWLSNNGIIWQLIATTAFTFTVAKLGYRISASGAITYDMAVDWLRTDV